MNERVAKVASLRDNSPLADRPEWLSPKDPQEVFGIGRSKAFNVCNELPHIYIGRSIRVNKKTIAKELIEKGRLPQEYRFIFIVRSSALYCRDGEL